MNDQYRPRFWKPGRDVYSQSLLIGLRPGGKVPRPVTAIGPALGSIKINHLGLPWETDAGYSLEGSSFHRVNLSYVYSVRKVSYICLGPQK